MQATINTPMSEPEAFSLADQAEEEIAARAYSYWEARGFRGGSPEEDWQRAVEELNAEHQKT